MLEKKLITIAIPCYNSQDYMKTAVLSAVSGGNEVEVLIVDDGSTDKTGEIGKDLEAEYPEIVHYIYKENGGHGDAVMCGLHHAQGIYFKVLDSDDYLDEDSLKRMITALQSYQEEDCQLDMFIANYMYDKEGEHRKVVIDYKSAFPQNKVFGWDDVGHFKVGHNLLMHAVVYRTALLKECGLQLPKHTFYVDNIFVYVPLPYVKNIYYLNVDFYRYFIGREDQSVNEKVMIKRIDQQIKVNKIMVEAVDLWKLPNRKLRKYMFNYLEIITIISTIMCIRSGTEENLEKKRELWKYIKEYDIRLFHRLRNGIMGTTMNLPGKGGRKISVAAYKISQKVVGFN